MFKSVIIIAFFICISCSSNRNISQQTNVYKKSIAYLKFEQEIEGNFDISNLTINPDLLLFSYYFCPYDMESKLFINDTIPSKNLMYLNKCRQDLLKIEETYKILSLSEKINLFEKDQTIKETLYFSEYKNNMLYAEFDVNKSLNVSFDKYSKLAFLIFFNDDLEVTHSLRFQHTVKRGAIDPDGADL